MGLAACLGVLGGCGEHRPAQSASATAGAALSQPQQDAEALGKDLFDVVDRVMSYASAHQGHLPATLRQAGIDSLTPLVVRRLAREGAAPRITVAFRRGGTALRSCVGTNDVLEDAMLHDGEFSLLCLLPSGEQRAFQVGKQPPPKGN